MYLSAGSTVLTTHLEHVLPPSTSSIVITLQKDKYPTILACCFFIDTQMPEILLDFAC